MHNDIKYFEKLTIFLELCFFNCSDLVMHIYRIFATVQNQCVYIVEKIGGSIKICYPESISVHVFFF